MHHFKSFKRCQPPKNIAISMHSHLRLLRNLGFGRNLGCSRRISHNHLFCHSFHRRCLCMGIPSSPASTSVDTIISPVTLGPSQLAAAKTPELLAKSDPLHPSFFYQNVLQRRLPGSAPPIFACNMADHVRSTNNSQVSWLFCLCQQGHYTELRHCMTKQVFKAPADARTPPPRASYKHQPEQNK